MGFERCHPAVNLIYFSFAVIFATEFQHPVFLFISFLCAFIYSVKRSGIKALVFNLCLLPLIVVFALYYSSFNHFGVTVLSQNIIGNNLTFESLVYGVILGVTGASVCMYFSCIFSVFTTDKIVYLLGKISPRLSLFLAIMLRMVPRIKAEAKRINMAQQGIGKGINRGSLWRRFCNCIRIISIMITWTIDSLTSESESMRSRGSSLRGRTAFSIYRFDNRDRAFVIVLFFCITLTLMAVLLGQTDMVCNPKIIWINVNPIFCVGYAAFCLMPFGLEVWTDYCFYKSRMKVLIS